MFPDTNKFFNAASEKEKNKFLATLDKALFSNQLNKEIDQEIVDNIVTTMKKRGSKQEGIDTVLTGIDKIRNKFTDLIIIVQGTTTVDNADIQMYFNNDSSSGLYSKTQLEGTGSTAGSGRTSGANFIGLTSNIGVDDTNPSIIILQFNNYSNTTTFKTVLSRESMWMTGASGAALRVGLWRNTAAITSISIKVNGSTWKSGSTFTLYGIKAA
jgi:hypothetical protein